MEFDLILRGILALVLVGGLIGVCAIAARKFLPKHLSASKHSQKRLAIIETTYIDPKRKLVLVKRDNVEHLLLLGHTSDLVIEHSIATPEGTQ